MPTLSPRVLLVLWIVTVIEATAAIAGLVIAAALDHYSPFQLR